MLNHDTELFPHHVDGQRIYDFSAPVAKVARHPTDPGVWGLKNVTTEKWSVTDSDGKAIEVEPGRNVSLTVGRKINFGRSQGEITS